MAVEMTPEALRESLSKRQAFTDVTILDDLIAERDRYRAALTTIASNDGFIPLGGVEEFAQGALNG